MEFFLQKILSNHVTFPSEIWKNDFFLFWKLSRILTMTEPLSECKMNDFFPSKIRRERLFPSKIQDKSISLKIQNGQLFPSKIQSEPFFSFKNAKWKTFSLRNMKWTTFFLFRKLSHLLTTTGRLVPINKPPTLDWFQHCSYIRLMRNLYKARPI